MQTKEMKTRPLTTASAVAAAIAVLSLSACGPHDTAAPTAYAGGAAPVDTGAATVAPDATAPVAPMPDPVGLQGQPVPAQTHVAAAPVPLPPVQPRYQQPPAYIPQAVAQAQPNYAQQPAYGQQPGQYQPPQYQTTPERERVQAPAVAHDRVGSIESIEPIRSRPQGSGAGAVIGGVLGGVLGNQFGHGLGRAAVTGLGAVGGAVAGNNVERNIHEGVVGYRVSVRLDNGSTRTFERSSAGGLHVGDRVHVDSESFHRV